MTEADKFGALSLGSVTGGQRPAAHAWRDAIRGVSIRVRALRVGVESPLHLNVVFHIPGEFLLPEFEGLRTGRYSARERKLMVQVALPETAPPVDAGRVLVGLLFQAVEEAERFANRKKLLPSGQLDGIRGIISQL